MKKHSAKSALTWSYLVNKRKGPSNLNSYVNWNEVNWSQAKFRGEKFYLSGNKTYNNLRGWVDFKVGQHTVSVEYHVFCNRGAWENGTRERAKVISTNRFTTNKTWKSGGTTKMISYDSRENKMVWSEGNKVNGKFKNKTTYVYSVKGFRLYQVIAGTRLLKIVGNGSNLTLPKSMLTGLHTPLKAGVDVNIYELELTRDDTCPVCQGYYDTWDRKKGIYEQEYKEYRDAVDDVNGAEGRFQTAVGSTLGAVGVGLLACGTGNLAGCGFAALSIVVGGAIVVRAAHQVDTEDSERQKKKEDMEAAESSMNNALASLESCEEVKCGYGCVPTVPGKDDKYAIT